MNQMLHHGTSAISRQKFCITVVISVMSMFNIVFQGIADVIPRQTILHAKKKLGRKCPHGIVQGRNWSAQKPRALSV